MLFSFLTQELAIDLGTANTVILMDNKIVLDEPSIVAFDQNTGKPVAFGQKARLMHGKTHPNIKTIRPLKDGVIADFYAAEQMLRGFVKMINHKKTLFTPNIKMVICIPSGSTEVEIRAVRDSSNHSGGSDVYMIFEPMAAAMGIGLDVEAPAGNMVVDIGGGTTEIAVISLGGIVSQQSIRVAGDVFTAEIQQYLRQQHNIKVGEITSEEIKMGIGAAITDIENTPEPFIVRGPNLMTAHPMEIGVTSQEVAHCLDKSLAKIESAILSVLEQTPPELYQDIVKKGIFLTGGGALLRGLDKRFTEKINIPFHVAEDPLRAVARGTSMALKNTSRYQFLMR
ncbi:MAG: rod shape-determining protein [Bacteroidales bacterium]|jgi:rod shape-determining protein MreB|nr:rod shape-determining protein [Bacteroidales bacterium]MBO7321874.1 rod shape-determining protein [Bacteroidales bacterium]MBO7763740.1 rod shape-determining protein [Bacteroidales bacterium]MBQ2243088.1 rod shape-determining protein [Bacteroidales bacterium]